MANKRKYPEVKGYWVYTIFVPSIQKYYVGVSKQQCSQRWQKSLYMKTALEQYLNEFDSMIKTVLVDNLTKEEALKYEDKIIQALSMNNLCINEHRSGLIKLNDVNAYYRELLKNNTEYRERKKEQVNHWRKDNKEQYREYQREWQRQYRLKNKDKINQQAKQRRLKKRLQKQNPQIN